MKKNFVIGLILILIVCSIGSVVFAEDLNELYSKQNEVKQQQNAASAQLEIVKSELSVTLQQVQQLSQNIDKYQTEVDQLDGKVNELQTSIADLERKLAIAQENYDENKKLLDNRLITIYENGETNYLDMLLTSKGLTDFISTYYLVSELAKCDMDFLNEIEIQKRDIEITKKSLEVQKEQCDKMRENKERTARILANTRTLKNDYMSQLSEEEAQIQQQMDEYIRQINAIESEILQIAMSNQDIKYYGGIMAWPTPGYTRITSPYGMREHPITGVYKLHTGVDIGAPMNANFIAVADGVVVKAGYNTAYGNMVIVDHGGGISTLYAHGDEIVAQFGQKVKKGDVILKVGKTGYATGPHAHFEVRVNGSAVDPMPYITSNQDASAIQQ